MQTAITSLQEIHSLIICQQTILSKLKTNLIKVFDFRIALIGGHFFQKH